MRDKKEGRNKEEDRGGGKTGTAKVVDESERASLIGWHKSMPFQDYALQSGKPCPRRVKRAGENTGWPENNTVNQFSGSVSSRGLRGFLELVSFQARS